MPRRLAPSSSVVLAKLCSMFARADGSVERATPILSHTVSRQSWNSGLRKWGRPEEVAHSCRTAYCGCSEADQLTVPPPPKVLPARTMVDASSEVIIPPFSIRCSPADELDMGKWVEGKW